VFHDLLSSKEEIFQSYEEIKNIVRKVVEKLNHYTKIVHWNRKEY
jgi:hypothetical protein